MLILNAQLYESPLLLLLLLLLLFVVAVVVVCEQHNNLFMSEKTARVEEKK